MSLKERNNGPYDYYGQRPGQKANWEGPTSSGVSANIIALAVAVLAAVSFLIFLLPSSSDDPLAGSKYDQGYQDGYDAAQAEKQQVEKNPLVEHALYNGRIIIAPSEERICPLTVSVKGEDAYYIFLDSVYYPHNDMAFTISPGQEVEIDVPADTYRIFYAVGQTWYGKTNLFGPDTMYYQCDGDFEFYTDDEYVYGHNIELYLQRNGNLSTEVIDADLFPG